MSDIIDRNVSSWTHLRALPLVFSLLLSWFPTADAIAEISSDPRPSIQAERLGPEERVDLDGHLSEPVWDRADPATDFRQQEPGEGDPATERTEVRIAYSPDRLYIGVMLFDSDPSGIRGSQKRRDAGIGSDDRFMWILDTFCDGRSGYFFEINPAGLMGDGLLYVSGGTNKSWDGIWTARVSRSQRGWSAEIEIPFRTLNFDPSIEEWGINFQRTVRRKSEELLWSGWRRTEGLFHLVGAGRLRGLGDLSQGLGLEARPYISGSQNLAGGRDIGSGDLGADFSYSMTPSLRLALTLNTDFSEADADDRQINLTRFPVSLPDRRQFFVEGSSAYRFGGNNGVNPFFSRHIGLAEGEPIPIVYGARLGGHVGEYELAALQVKTDGADHAIESFTVARVKRKLFEQSSIGAIYTRRSTAATAAQAVPDRHTVGVDFDLYTSRFMGNKNLQFEAMYLWHTDPGDFGSTSDNRSARGFRVNYPNDIWQAHVSFREIGEEFDPALGFTPRNGFRRFQPEFSWNPRPARWPAVRQFQFRGWLERLTDLDGVLETRTTGLVPFNVRFQTGDSLGFETIRRYELLREPFEISDGVVLPAGEYSYDTVGFDLSTASQRPVSGSLNLDAGEFWSGTIRRSRFGLTVRPGPSTSLSTDLELQSISLAEGTFSTTLTRFSASWYPTPWISLTSRVQYDDVSEGLGLNVRLRWILRPGSDLYAVYAHEWLETLGRFATLGRNATTKLNYTYRF